MGFKVQMTEIRIRPGFLFLCAVSLLFCGIDLAICALGAVLLHELAHVFAARIFGGKLALVEFSWAGISMHAGFAGMTGYVCDALCAAAGPLANLLVGFFVAAIAAREILFMFAGANILLGIYNIIPAIGLDGGVVLGSLLKKFLPFEIAEILLTVVAALVSLGVCGLGCWLCVKAGNMTLLLCGVGLGINVWRNRPRGLFAVENKAKA